MAVGAGMSESGLMHNFVDQEILDDGGFAVQMEVIEINSVTPESSDRYAGFGVGLFEMEATLGEDISNSRSIRGRDRDVAGRSDFFVELDIDGNVKVWSHGALLSAVAVGANSGTLRAEFSCDGFEADGRVEVAVYFDGSPIDIDPDTAALTRSFVWEYDSSNYIGLSCRASSYVNLDNLLIETLGGRELFSDTFARSNNTDIDAAVGGMGGALFCDKPVAWDIYAEGYEGSGFSDSIAVVGQKIRMAKGAGMSECGLMHNFIDQAILDAGGFSMEIAVAEINTASVGTDFYAGFGVGLTEAEAASGYDISDGDGSFRGMDGERTGTSDFFVELDSEQNIKVWRYGQLLETVAVGTSEGILTAGFECDGFSTSDTVVVTVFLNGEIVDMNPSDAESVSQVFNWQNDGENYVGLSCRSSSYADLDHVAVRTFPVYNSMFAQTAFEAGLSGNDAALEADGDGDGVSNFAEWSMGADMAVSNAPAKAIYMVDATGDSFVFGRRQMIGYEAFGINYQTAWSTDLTNWVDFVPVTLGSTSVVENAAFEDVELGVESSIADGKATLFIRGTIAP